MWHSFHPARQGEMSRFLIVAYGVATSVATIPLTPGGIGLFDGFYAILALSTFLAVGMIVYLWRKKMI